MSLRCEIGRTTASPLRESLPRNGDDPCSDDRGDAVLIRETAAARTPLAGRAGPCA